MNLMIKLIIYRDLIYLWKGPHEEMYAWLQSLCAPVAYGFQAL